MSLTDRDILYSSSRGETLEDGEERTSCVSLTPTLAVKVATYLLLVLRVKMYWILLNSSACDKEEETHTI